MDEIRFKNANARAAESFQLQHAISSRFKELQKRNFDNFKSLFFNYNTIHLTK